MCRWDIQTGGLFKPKYKMRRICNNPNKRNSSSWYNGKCMHCNHRIIKNKGEWYHLNPNTKLSKKCNHIVEEE